MVVTVCCDISSQFLARVCHISCTVSVALLSCNAVIVAVKCKNAVILSLCFNLLVAMNALVVFVKLCEVHVHVY